MKQTSAASRRRHTDLQPLRTRSSAPVDPTRRKSTHSQGSPGTNSTATLPSPNIVAAHAYYLELKSPIEPEDNAFKRRRSLIRGHQFPRRHSVLPSTANLVSQLENFTFASAVNDLQPVPEGDETERKIKTEDVDICMSEVKECTPDVGKTQQGRKSSLLCGTPQELLRQVPFQYNHDHLRDWGYAYLGNPETADVFVNAMSLRRPSLALVKEDEFQAKSVTPGLVIIRARVMPKAKERKPFLIQRQFNINELRSSIPKAHVPDVKEEDTTRNLPRRSRRLRRSSAWQAREIQRKGNVRTPISERSVTLEHRAVPIHIEYALHYLPVLGALMLSGHVRKGDAIDLPIPHPEVWRDTITNIYTGRGEVGSAVRENILYLAGHGD